MSKAAPKKATAKFNLEALYQRYSWYGFRILWLVVGLFLLLVLATYDLQDGGYFSTNAAQQISNSGGLLGAYLSDLVLGLFGVTAFVLPVILIKRNLVQLLASSNTHSRPTIYKVIALIVTLIGASTMVAMHMDNSLFDYPRGSGGLVGAKLAWPLTKGLGLAGSNLLLFALTFLAASHLLALKWGAITAKTGAVVERSWQDFYRQLTSHEPKNKTPKPAVTTKPKPKDSDKGPSLWQSAKTKLASLFQREEKVNALENVQVGRTADLFGQAEDNQISDEDVLSALEKPAKKKAPATKPVKATAAVAEAASISQPVPKQAQSATPTAPEEGKKDVKIVPLEQTHKQDTGDSTATQDGKAKKSKECPPVSLLDPPAASLNPGISKAELEQMSELLEAKLMDFGVVAEVVEVNPGPVITRFEIQPAPGTKVSKISNLAKDLARSMAVMSVRVVEVIAGKSVIGIEIPNQNREMVRISEVLGSKTYQAAGSPLTMGLGNDIAGKPVVVDLAKMPHLLVAGTTGSGKSVGVNAMLISLLLKSTPEQVRLLLVDPKMLELSIYDGIPHLLAPVITDMKEAAGGLRWCVAEMERRYKVMASQGVRNIAGYNTKVNNANAAGTPIPDPVWQPDELMGETPEDRPDLEEFPYIVVVVDEFADMMMIVGKKVEELIARIAQKARAAGIHLILATQRPSVDVITGLIKANVPTRIAFQVSSKIDSRTILDQGGAESLLGHGDMLYLPAGKSVPERVHGAFVSDEEVHRVVEDWKTRGAPEFVDAIIEGTYDQEGGAAAGGSGGDYEEEMDQLYDEAVAFVTETRRASISSVQRKFKIGYNRAARMIEAMEAAGVITSQAHNGSREVIAPPPVKD